MPSQYGEYGVLPTQFTGDKLSICRDYLTGQCSQSLCHLVHPGELVFGLGCVGILGVGESQALIECLL